MMAEAYFQLTWLCRLGTGTLTVLVGPESQNTRFVLYTDLAKQHSDLFKSRMEPPSGKPRGTIHLSYLSAEEFKVFVAFMYTGQIFSMRDEAKLTLSSLDDEWQRLAELWSLGQALRSTSFKDAVVDSIMHKINTGHSFPIDIHETMAKNLKEPSGIRRLLVDLAATSWRTAEFERRCNKAELLHFQQDLLLVMHKIQQGILSPDSIRAR